MALKIRWLVLWVAFALLTSGCTAPTSPSPPPSQSATPTVSATATTEVDFTQPGAAERIVMALITASGSEQVIGVEVQKTTASISVLKSKKAETWAFRTGKIQRVPSDIEYVNQAVIKVEDFDISDVGALFRTAAAISGSSSDQELRIIDYSAGEIAMTVSTVPESRPVFFNKNGTPLATLDFNTKKGVEAGLRAAIGTRKTITGAGITASIGAWIDYPGPEDTTLRRTRAAKFPPAVAGRKDEPLPPFLAKQVSADAIWTAYQQLHEKDPTAKDWSVTITDPKGVGKPQMSFVVGNQFLTTDMAGKPIK